MYSRFKLCERQLVQLAVHCWFAINAECLQWGITTAMADNDDDGDVLTYMPEYPRWGSTPSKANARVPDKSAKPCVVLVTSGSCELPELHGLVHDSGLLRRLRCNGGPDTLPSHPVAGGHMRVHGLAVMHWSLVRDLTSINDQELRDLAVDFCRASEKTQALFVYGVLSCWRLSGGSLIMQMASASTRQSVSQAMRQFGSLDGTSPSWHGTCSLADAANRLTEKFQCEGFISRWETHSSIAEKLVADEWSFELRGFSTLMTRHTHSSADPAASLGQKLLSWRNKDSFRPAIRQLQKLTASCKSAPSLHEQAKELREAAAGENQPDTMLVVPLQKRHKVLLRSAKHKFYPFRMHYEMRFLIQCVFLARGLRDKRQVGATAHDVIEALFGNKAHVVKHVMGDAGFKWPSQTVLRHCQIRLDFACMLFRRAISNSCRKPNGIIVREVLFDASRAFGREVFAARECVIAFPEAWSAPCAVVSRRLPTVTLAHRHMSASDKADALLHCVWLEYGPDKASLEAWLDSVRVIPTDLGVESLIANAANIVPALYNLMPSGSDSPYLFPNGLRFPGWHRLCHNFVKTVVSKCMPWYPQWLDQVRHVATFLSLPAYLETLHASLQAKGVERIDHLNKKQFCDRFIESRWGSLVRVCQAIRDAKDFVQKGWDSEHFRVEASTAATLAKVAAPDHQLFWHRCSFICVVMGPVEELRTWGGGCACHEEARKSGRVVNCILAGRRMKDAWQRVQDCTAQLEQAIKHGFS